MTYSQNRSTERKSSAFSIRLGLVLSGHCYPAQNRQELRCLERLLALSKWCQESRKQPDIRGIYIAPMPIAAATWRFTPCSSPKPGPDRMGGLVGARIVGSMPTFILCLFRFLRLLFSSQQAVAVENLALRRQLAAYKRG